MGSPIEHQFALRICLSWMKQQSFIYFIGKNICYSILVVQYSTKKKNGGEPVGKSSNQL